MIFPMESAQSYTFVGLMTQHRGVTAPLGQDCVRDSLHVFPSEYICMGVGVS